MIVKQAHILRRLTYEITTHIKNAQGGPLVSVFGVVSGFNCKLSFTSQKDEHCL